MRDVGSDRVGKRLGHDYSCKSGCVRGQRAEADSGIFLALRRAVACMVTRQLPLNASRRSTPSCRMGSKTGARAALPRLALELTHCRDARRLVLENDEICYSVDDLMPICEELNIPLVFGQFSSHSRVDRELTSNAPDYHHDWINPSSQPPAELMPRILATWERKGIRCKQHLSEPRRGAVTIMVSARASFSLVYVADSAPSCCTGTTSARRSVSKLT